MSWAGFGPRKPSSGLARPHLWRESLESSLRERKRGRVLRGGGGGSMVQHMEEEVRRANSRGAPLTYI